MSQPRAQAILPKASIRTEDGEYEVQGRLAQMILILLHNRDKLNSASKGKLLLFFAGDSVHASLEDQLSP